MRIADTSALYAVFARGDVHHDDAREAMGDPEPVVIPSEVFVETIDLIQYRIGHDEAAAASIFLRDLAHVHVRVSTAKVLASGHQMHAEAKGKLSLADSLVVAWCGEEDALPFTFDREIVRRSGRAL